MSLRRSLRLASIALVAALAACTDAAGPSVADVSTVAGSYLAGRAASGGTLGAFSFTTSAGGRVVDRLADGAVIDLTLHANGSTTGRLRIPLMDGEGEPQDGGVFEADLAGRWTLANGVIELDHADDTFLRDMPLTVRGDRLEGEATFDGVTVRLVLVRR
jgi:hypothetical protein